MKLQIKELCIAKGITSPYKLAKELKLSMPTAYRAFANEIKQFTPETLEILCKGLKCSPNEIFGYIELRNKKPQSIQLEAEKPASTPETPIKAASSEGLTVGEVAKRLGVEPGTVRDFINGEIRSKGKLKATKGKGNEYFVGEADLQEFINNS